MGLITSGSFLHVTFILTKKSFICQHKRAIIKIKLKWAIWSKSYNFCIWGLVWGFFVVVYCNCSHAQTACTDQALLPGILGGFWLLLVLSLAASPWGSLLLQGKEAGEQGTEEASPLNLSREMSSCSCTDIHVSELITGFHPPPPASFFLLFFSPFFFFDSCLPIFPTGAIRPWTMAKAFKPLLLTSEREQQMAR